MPYKGRQDREPETAKLAHGRKLPPRSWSSSGASGTSTIKTGTGMLRLASKGRSLKDTSVLAMAVGGHSYTVEVDV